MSRELQPSALAAYRPLLGELVELGDVLCDAIGSGNGVLAIAASHQARRIRAALADVDVPAPEGTSSDVLAIIELIGLTERARTAEAALDRWLGRAMPAEAVLLASPLGVAAMTDSMLPAVWDFETDLVVLVGDRFADVAAMLADLGQRRVIVWTGQACRHDVIRAETLDEIAAAVRTMDPCPPGRLVVRGVAGSDPARVESITVAVRDAMSDLRIHRNTVREFSRTWLAQGAANLPALARWPSIAAVEDRFKGKPMAIVAPGPSLANNIAQLAAIRDQVIVCAFSHSLKPLIAAGITPDLVVTVDPQDVRYHFGGMALDQVGAVVNGATVHPALFALGAPRYLTLSANSAIDNWMYDGVGDRAIAAGGGSVATTAFSLALRWGCDPIVFLGLDLSFTGGSYYVSTSCDGNARAVVHGGAVRVEGWSTGFRAMKAAGGPAAPRERSIELPAWSGDGTVPSSFMFSMFHRWFVERMRDVGETRVFNCTEGGARIDGMTHVPLAEVAAALPGPIDVAGALAETFASVDIADRQARMRFHVSGFVRAIGRARRLAIRCRHLARIAARGDADAEKALTSCERALARAMVPLGFVSMVAQREIEHAQRAALRDPSLVDHLAESVKLFDAAIAAIDEVRPVLHDVLAALRADDATFEATGG